MAEWVRWLRNGMTSLVVISFASVLHVIWGLLLATETVAAHSTPVAAVVSVLGGRWPAVVALLGAAVLAQIAPFARKTLLPLLLLPQQALLFISAGGGIYAAAVGHYADNTHRGWPFILGDQMPVILAALLYTFAAFSYQASR